MERLTDYTRKLRGSFILIILIAVLSACGVGVDKGNEANEVEEEYKVVEINVAQDDSTHHYLTNTNSITLGEEIDKAIDNDSLDLQVVEEKGERYIESFENEEGSWKIESDDCEEECPDNIDSIELVDDISILIYKE